MTEDDFFVNVRNVPDLRKNLLLSSKYSLEALKIHLHLREIHKEKLSLKKTFDSQLKELAVLFSELFDLLPNHELLLEEKEFLAKQKKAKSSPSKKSVTKKKSTTKKVLPEKKLSQVEIINKALEDIEKKLSSL